MIKSIISYTADGTIVQIQNTDDSVIPFIPAVSGQTLLVSPTLLNHLDMSWNTQYVLDGIITPRATMALAVNKTSFTADGSDSVVVSGIPAGAKATITGAVTAGPETVTDGSLTITSTVVGAINCTITNAPANLDWSVTLNAV